MEYLTALIIAVSLLVTAVAGFLKIWYEVKKVHTIVNSQRKAMEDKIEELRQLLAESRREK